MDNTFELHIKLKYKIIGFEHLQFGNKMLINIQTGRVKKQCINGGMIGYWLDSKTFKSIRWVKKNLIKIEKEKIPF